MTNAHDNTPSIRSVGIAPAMYLETYAYEQAIEYHGPSAQEALKVDPTIQMEQGTVIGGPEYGSYFIAWESGDTSWMAPEHIRPSTLVDPTVQEG